MSAPSGLVVVPVEGRREVDHYIRAAEVAQGGDPNWVPPLHAETKGTLDEKAVPFTRENPHQAFVALRGGKPLGRIFVVEDRAHLALHRDRAGHFGFLEAVDEDAVWDALVEAGAAWLRGRGLLRMEGPYSASINHEIGLLVEGFGTRPTVRTTHAQPYYATQLERLGFRGVKDVVAHEGDIAASTFPERVSAMRARWPGAADLTLWTMDPKDLEGSARRVNAVYNDAWSDNWNAVPVSEEEAVFIAKLTKPILRADWTSIAEWRGEPVGVLALVPDVNEAIADLKGRLLPFGWAKLLWRLKIAGVSRARVPLIGVRKQFRGTRIGAMAAATLLADAVRKARAAGIERMEISWMLEDNRGVLNLVESLPATRTKTWRIYSRAL